MKIKLAQYGISHDHASGKARVMQENDEVDFCGIFEPTPDTRNTLGENPLFADAHWFSSKEEMLEDETIVGIAVQGKVSENLGFAREVLEHGKHVWLDKPAGDDLEAFRTAGRALMDLHIDYETVNEYPLVCLVDDEVDAGEADAEAYRIDKKMRWAKNGKETNRSVLEINHRCKLIDIPDEAHQYTVSGRTPLDWAIDSLRFKHDKPSGITDDPNGWHDWADQPFNLIRHLRRLPTFEVLS